MKRYLYYLLGMNILVLGITCNTLSYLGVGAFSTLPYAVSFLTFLTFGQANIVFYLIYHKMLRNIYQIQFQFQLLFQLQLILYYNHITELQIFPLNFLCHNQYKVIDNIIQQMLYHLRFLYF